ncbi:hypothetical protein PFDG_01263 [Plasmodium falciparum Dd2]|uniref:Uncharacterized protein n=1 Tax=Plasmodium falciparum (isolate Dd2) TaxID=57267 RepID=A0A0L7LYP5_PLAF4|nr:hypothetical protein PFDG_01263 [Plasmodium falciparum Dd2]
MKKTKNSYNVKNEQLFEHKGYPLEVEMFYSLQNLVHKKDADIFDRGFIYLQMKRI